MKHKKYALLDNGNIEPLWYDDVEMRQIEKGYLIYDKVEFYDNGSLKSISLCKSKIIKEADTIEELEAK